MNVADFAVANDEGYRNLCRLITHRHAGDADSTFDLKSAGPAHSKGLTIFTQSPELLSAWHGRGVTVARAIPRKPNGSAFKLRQTSRYLGVPAVTTPGSFFLAPDESERRLGVSP